MSIPATHTNNVGLPNKELAKAARSLVDCVNNQRKHRRSPLVMPCTVVPVDSNNKACGTPLAAVTTDITTAGIGIMYTAEIEPQRVLVSISKPGSAPIHVIAEIVCCGEVNGFFKIGAKLIDKVES